jgi:hypothetical protein
MTMPQDHPPELVDPKLEARLALLEEVFCKFARDEGTLNVIGGGFGNVSDQLESMTRYLQGINEQMAPLRQLGGPKANLDHDQKARLKYLIKGWTPPRWNNLGAVSIPELPVRYIGQSVPEQPHLALEADYHDRSASS